MCFESHCYNINLTVAHWHYVWKGICQLLHTGTLEIAVMPAFNQILTNATEFLRSS